MALRRRPPAMCGPRGSASFGATARSTARSLPDVTDKLDVGPARARL